MVIESGFATLLRFIPALPLAAAICNAIALVVVRRPASHRLVVITSSSASLLAFAISLLSLFELLGHNPGARTIIDDIGSWIGLGAGGDRFGAEVALQFDELTAIFVPLVALLGFVLHVHAIGFLREDARPDSGTQRYFVHIDLLMAASFIVLLADNLVLLFVGWSAITVMTGVLIAFWYGDRDAADAGRAALSLGLIGDAGLLLGILGVFWAANDSGGFALQLRALPELLPRYAQEVRSLPWGGEIGLVAVFAACFAVAILARMAQLPFHLGLVAAARAPATASAWLVLGSTTGIYLACRLTSLFGVAQRVPELLAWIGAATAIFAALGAISQRDILRCVLWATVSQLGCVLVGIGCGAYGAAVHHAIEVVIAQMLLLLAAGAVVMCLDGERNIRRMGGMRGRLPWTFAMASIAVLSPGALLSREEILHAAFVAPIPSAGFGLYLAVAVGVTICFAGLFRVLLLVFAGSLRSPLGFRGEFSDPSRWMLAPLWVLGFLCVLGLVLNPAQFWGDMFGVENSASLSRFLEGVVPPDPAPLVEGALRWQLVGGNALALLIGFWFAYSLHTRWLPIYARIARWLRPPREALWGDDDGRGLERRIAEPLARFSRDGLERYVEQGVIESFLVRGVSNLARGVGKYGLRHGQPGFVQAQLVGTFAGVLALMWFFTR